VDGGEGGDRSLDRRIRRPAFDGGGEGSAMVRASWLGGDQPGAESTSSDRESNGTCLCRDSLAKESGGEQPVQAGGGRRRRRTENGSRAADARQRRRRRRQLGRAAPFCMDCGP